MIAHPGLLTKPAARATIGAVDRPSPTADQPTSTSPTGQFDLRALFLAADAERERGGASWAALARQIGVAASTMRRYEHAADAEADGVLAVVAWLGAAPEDYLTGVAAPGERLAATAGGHIRVDMELVAAAEGDPRGAQGRTRTTIQRLVEVTQRAGRPVASLTRISEL